MRLILVGPPGSGKGTQAQLLSTRLSLAHIATGDILRETIRNETPLGKLAKPYMQSGGLVPDDLVNELIVDRFRKPDRPENFILDGYPRTLAQAASFDQVLRQQFLNISAVLVFRVEDDEIVRRLTGRWSCPDPSCKASYHVLSRPPKVASVCDKCGTQLTQRTDDKEETVRERLRVYNLNTANLIPYYRTQGLVQDIVGQGSIEEIYAQIVRLLKQAGLTC